MKANVRYIVLGVLLLTALNVNARVFETGEVIYVKMLPSNWNWYGTDTEAGKFAYFYNNGTSVSTWSEELIGVSYCDDVLQVRVPAGDWTHVILTRNSVKSGPDWSNVYDIGNDSKVNKTADIAIPDNQNYLDNFRQFKDKDSYSYDMWHWSDCYFYRPSDDPTSPSITKIDQADREIVEVCTQSSDDPLSLQPRLISPTEGYDYNQGRTWFKWDGTKWKELANANSNWGFDGPGGLNETIGAANSHAYYFLSTKNHDNQRFIEIAVTKDCSPTCEITDFGVVTSNVNIHDSTYVLDGIVAFKDATGKTLRISVTDAKGEHHVDYDSPTTPWIFSLPGLFADGASGVIAKASFIGTEYTRNSAPYTAPDAISSTPNISNISKTHGEATTIDPAAFDPVLLGADGFKWHDDNTTDHVRNISAYNFDTTIVYTYYEYEKAPEVAGNLIVNGDFSLSPFDYGTTNYNFDITVPPYSTISQYHYWGKDVTSASDFYNLMGNISGGMAIVQDANAFWKRYTKKIEKKSGTHFALFDADNSGSKNAWVIETGATQTNLKLAKGTNYMFSFWVANINNYGEMNNAAKLQFEITYSLDGGSTWSTPEQLGNPIDLNDYLDNLWHQNSYVYTSTVDASNVRISVRDLNTNENPGGNDFALDDIKFQPISVVSQAIKYWHRFVVNIFEDPVVVEKPQITITKTPACGNTDFEMQVKVDYSTLNSKYPVKLQLTDNIYGDIFATPITITPAANPNSITLTLSTATYAMLVADGDVHTLTATIIREDDHHNNKGGSNSNTYTSPGVPSMLTPVTNVLNTTCDKTTFDLEVISQYTAFKGTKLHYDWDGKEWKYVTVHSLSYKESTLQTIKDTLRNLVADGKEHTLRIYSNNGLDCEQIITPDAPYMPNIKAVTTTVLHDEYDCSSDQYKVKIEAEFENGQGHRIIFKDWYTGKEQKVTTDAMDTKASYTFTYDWDAAPTEHEYNVYFEGAKSCDHKKSYISPAKPALTEAVTSTDKGCDITTYTLKLDLTYTNQKGSKFFAAVDGGTPVSVSNPNVAAQTSKSDVTLSITGLPADGKEHKYSIWTDNVADCSLTDVVFPAPYGPKITSATATVQPFACGDDKYKVNVEVAFTNGQGHNLIIEDWKGNKQIIPTLVGDTKKEYLFSYDWEAPTTHAYKVYFEGNEACKESHKPSFDVPFLPLIDAVVVEGLPAEKLSCGTTSYDVNVKVTTHFDATGYDIILKYIDGSELSKTVSAAGTETVIPLTLHNLDAADQTVTAKIDATPACPKDGTYTPAQLKHITPLFDVTVGENACGPLDYTVSGTVTFDKPDGKLIVLYDDAHTDTVTVASDATSANFSIEHMTASETSMVLKAKFTGSLDDVCTVSSNTFSAPTKPAIEAKKLTFSDLTCSDVTATLTFDLDYTFQQGKLHYNVDGGTDSIKVITEKSSSLITLSGLKYEGIPADGKAHTLHISFDGANSCTKDIATPIAPLSYVIDAVVLTTDVPAMVTCETASYDVDVKVTTHFDATGKKVVLIYDDNGTAVTTDPIEVSGKTVTKTITLHNLANGSHTISAAFSTKQDCKTISAAYTAPSIAQIQDFTVTTSPRACDDDKFTISGSIAFDMADGNLTVYYDDDHKQVFPAPVTSPVAFSIPNMTEASHTVKAWFGNSPSDGCKKESAAFTAPTKPTIEAKKLTFSDLTCSDVTATLTFDLDYTFQQGKLHYNVDGGTDSVRVITEKNASSLTLTGLKYEGIPADGQAHTLHISFDGANSCAKDVPIAEAPLSNALTSVAVTSIPTMILCDQTEYNAVVSVVMPFDKAIGRKLVIAYEGKTETVVITSNPMVSTVEMTKTDASGLTVEAWFEGAPSCKVTSAAYTAPEKLSCDKYLATVCKGDSYIWPLTGLSYGPFTKPGIDTIVNSLNIHDSLFVTVNALPEISIATIAPVVEDAEDIHIPYTVTGGNPNRFVITLNGATSSQKRGLTDEIVLSKPASLVPGSYTVTVEVQDTITGCHSETSTSLTIVEKAVTPSVSIQNVVPSIADECGKLSSVTFDVDYLNQTGTLTYWLDDLTSESKTSPFTAGSKTSLTVTGLTLDNVPADGLIHKLHVTFNEETTGKAETDFTALLSNALTSVAVTSIPTMILCDQAEYNAVVSVVMPFDKAIGRKLVIAYEGKTETVVITSNPMVSTVEMTKTDASGLTVEAWFEGVPSCKVTSAAYTAPEKLSCDKYLATVCEGDSYTWPLTGLSYGPFTKPGIDTIVNSLNIHDSLFVTVNALPEISIATIAPVVEDAEDIHIPYTVTGGTPNRFVITLNGATSSQKRGLTDEIILSKPASLVPGSYTVTVEVQDTITGCHSETSASLTIEEKAVTPSVSIQNVVPSIADECGKLSSVTFDVDYLNQTGTLTYWLDDLTSESKTSPFTAGSKSPLTVSGLTLDNVPADGLIHKLHVTFNEETTGKAETDFTTPLSNALTSVAVTSIPTMVLCDQTEYNAVISVAMPFDKAIGRKIVIAYEGKTETVVITSNPMVATLKMTKTDASGLTVEAYFEGAEACKVTSPAYTAPEKLSCDKYLATVCEGDSYTWPLTGLSYGPFTTPGIDTIVNSLNVHDSLFVTVNALPEINIATIAPIVEDAEDIHLPYTVTGGNPNRFVITLNGATSSQKRGLTDEIVLSKPASLVPGSYTVTVEVQDTITGCHSETSASLTIEEKAVTPSVSIRNVVPSIADECGKLSSVTFDVDYLNQTGTLTYWLDDLTSESKTSPFTAGSKTPLTVTGLTLDNVPADGLIHKLHVTFNEETTGKAETDFTAPLSNALTSVAVTSIPTMVLCDQTEYNAVVTVAMPFDKAIGRKIVIAYEGKTETVVITSNPMVATLKMTKTDASGLTVEAWFEGAPSCKVTSASYTAPEKLSCDKYLATVCEGDSYIWPLTGLSYGPFTKPGIDTIVNSLNIHDSLFVTVNALPEISIATIAPVVEDAEEIHIPYTVTGGNPNRFVITLNGATSSQKRGLTDEIVLSKPASLVPGSYTVTVEVQDTITVCHSETSTSLTIVEKAVTPSVSIQNVVPSIADECGKLSSVTFDVDYLNQTGTLTYWLDDLTSESKTSPFTAGSKTPLTVTGLTLDNVPADGLIHKLHVTFNEETTGKAETDFTAPLTHAIESVTVSDVPASVACNETGYTVTVTIHLPFAAPGAKFVINVEGRDTAVYAGVETDLIALIPMQTVNASGLTVTARHCEAPACLVTSAAFDAPVRVGCVKDYADICEGESYTWSLNGQTYSPETAGLYTYTQDNDSLFLTVREQPAIRVDVIDRVCQDEAEIRWPFAVLAGTPDVFTVRINDKDYNLTADGSELVLPTPADLPAGDYTAVFTVGDAAVSCTSTAESALTLAAGDLIYSKWEDLLFVSNADNSFVAFQWYEDGNIIAGADKQYLFNQNGLPGLYFCRMTTTDNRTVYTCEIQFDDAIPSRTVSGEGQESQSVRMYDPMGRTVTGTPDNGIYIIVEEVDGIRMVRKIAVFE